MPVSELFDNVIDAYSRSQALADGALMAVPPALTRVFGLRCPCAITATAAAAIGAGTETTEEISRLKLALSLARNAALTDQYARIVTFSMPSTDPEGEPVDVVFHIGPGDTTEIVFTLMLPGED